MRGRAEIQKRDILGFTFQYFLQITFIARELVATVVLTIQEKGHMSCLVFAIPYADVHAGTPVE